MKIILGIMGLSKSGKDTFAEFLQEFGAVNVALADPLKRICRDVYGFSDLQLWGPSDERNKPDERYPRAHTWIKALPVVDADGISDDDSSYVCACCNHKGVKVSYRSSAPSYAQLQLGIGQEETVVPVEDKHACFLTPRYALQLLGTEFGRQCYDPTWVELCLRTAKELLEGLPYKGTYSYPSDHTGPRETYDSRIYPKYTPQLGIHAYEQRAEASRAQMVTVTDVRFKNEMAGIHAAGGFVIRVKRPGAGLGGGAGLHPSEREQASIPDSAFYQVVQNTGTLEELKATAQSLGRHLTDLAKRAEPQTEP